MAGAADDGFLNDGRDDGTGKEGVEQADGAGDGGVGLDQQLLQLFVFDTGRQGRDAGGTARLARAGP